MTHINDEMILDQLKQNNFKLLGQIAISDEQYDDLLDYLRVFARGVRSQTIISSNLMVALGLVQIAIRHYKEGHFWSCFLEQIGFGLPSAKTTYLGQIFYKTIQKYELFCPRQDGSISQYVECIKAHAFVTNYYMQGFFDFSYAYFENNLFRQLSDDLSDDLEDLSSFMETTLNSKADTIVSGTSSGKAAKSYRLLKSTRTAFAQCDINTLESLFYPVLKTIDLYFYDNVIPEASSDRFQQGFIQWCETQAEKEITKKGRAKNARQVYSHKPFIKVNVDREQAFIVIPPQKLRRDDCNGNACAEVAIGGIIEKYPLELYHSFGLYISEEKRIPISKIFDAIEITICSLSEKSYRIPAADYRIFNKAWESLSKFNKGHNYILVKPGITTSWKQKTDLIDYTDMYANWQYFSAQISEESVFYVGNKPLSLIGEFSSEPIYEKPIEYFSVYDEKGKQLTASQSHPSISFVLEKVKVGGAVLLINEFRYTIDEITEKNCFDWPTDKSKVAITILLDQFLDWVDGHYTVKLDIPGGGIEQLCEYVFLKTFKCRFNRPRYTYVPEAELAIKTGGYRIQPIDARWRILSETDSCLTYGIPLDNSCDKAEFLLIADKEYRISVPLKVFCYGFSAQNLHTQKEEYLWYADLQENLYVKIPGAKTAGAYLGRDNSCLILGETVAPDLFRIDISAFIDIIKSDAKKRFYYINIEYTDNAIRRIALPPIYRNVEITPYFHIRVANGTPCVDLNIRGKAQVYLSAKEHSREQTEKTAMYRKLIQNGINWLPELEPEKLYDLFPVMEEADEFGLDVREEKLKTLMGVGAVDIDNLTNCRLTISKLFIEDEEKALCYDYFLDLREKEESIYTGFLFGRKLAENKKSKESRYQKDQLGRFVKASLGKVRAMVCVAEGEIFSITLQCFSKEDEDWMIPYYDSEMKEIVHCDDSRLMETYSKENRYQYLDEDNCFFTVDANKIKRIEG